LEYLAEKRRVRRLVMGGALALALAGGTFWQMRPNVEKSADQVGSDTANSPDGVWLFFGLRASIATEILAGVALPNKQTVSAESSAPF
jgi:hypothetical protein